jgi:hypothetical protein
LNPSSPRAVGLLLLIAASATVRAYGASTSSPADESTTVVPAQKYQWLDQVRGLVYETVWESAMHVDRWFGSEEPDVAYEQASGSIVPGLLWDRYRGWQTLFRFIGNVPLPQLSDSLHAFIGRLNPEEFVSESQAASGAIPNPYSPFPQDETILGIQYYQPVHPGLQWDSGAGVPLSLSRFDPYAKGGYLYQIGQPSSGVLLWRQDAFYQDSLGGFGVTSRIDLQRLVTPGLLVSWTASSTFAQRSYGWNGYSTLDAYYSYAPRRAVVAELEVNGATQAAVPLQDYGVKVAYRRSILRDWLILEVRASVDWPRLFPWQRREASPGIGVAFEMEFGSDVFQARPVTF